MRPGGDAREALGDAADDRVVSARRSTRIGFPAEQVWPPSG